MFPASLIVRIYSRLAATLLTAPLLTTLVLLVIVGGSPQAFARDSEDHEQAMQAVQSGTILPLGELLSRLERDYPGQVLEVELEEENGNWIYEIRVLQQRGRLIKVKLDARTADIISRKQR